MSVREPEWLTESEYLAFERAAATKHEYRRGRVVAMVGASRAHNRIVVNLAGELRARLRGGPCEPFVNDLRVRVTEAGLYTYPDVAVVCGEPQFDDSAIDTLLNPTLISEVLSPSTELYDRGLKFRDYRKLASLQEYVLVWQQEARVEQFRRLESGLWVWQETVSLDGTVDLASIGCTLPLRQVYERVELP